MSAIKVRNLRDDLAFGSIVEGLNRQTLADDDVRGELNALFEDRGIHRVQGRRAQREDAGGDQQGLRPAQGPSDQVHAARHRFRGSRRRRDRHALLPRNDPNNVGGLVEIGGRRLARFSPWHFDHCYNNELNRAGVLRAPINAPVGGRTGFTDGIELYKKFPADMLAKLERMNIIYTLDTRLTKMRFGVNFKPLGEAPQAQRTAQGSRHLPACDASRGLDAKHRRESAAHRPLDGVGIEHHENAEGDALLR